jgi:metal-responsive CopG/Arc/MetJ family transcriptional regulator
MEELVTISARIQKSQAETIEKLASKKGVDKSTIIRQLLTEAIQKQKIEETLEQVRKMKITVWKAAQQTGVTYREMLQLLKAYNIPFPLTREELKREIEEITGRKEATA